jgi:hypothetical protein
MDVHHRLRRDPNWHPNGCNLCGIVREWRCVVVVGAAVQARPPMRRPSSHLQVGHQAATCPKGSVDWRERLGDDAYIEYFTAAPTVFHSELEASRPVVDLPKLEAAAREWAAGRVATGVAAKEPIPPARRPPRAAPGVAVAPDGLPPGWGAAVDAKGRTYYWNRLNKGEVKWTRPTAPARPAA